MEKDELRKTIIKYLEGHNAMSLSTSLKDWPHAASVFYVNLQFDLYFISSPGSRHGQNLSVNHRVSATINEDYWKWSSIKGLQLEGHATRLGRLSEHDEIATAFSGKFPDVSKFFQTPEELPEPVADKVVRVHFYQLHPTRISYIDNSMGFGYRQVFEPGHSGNHEDPA